MWYRRFRDDHPELDTSILKAKEAARYEYEEAGVEETKQWFKRLDEVITRYRIGALEIWNADQAGIRVGILRERVQCLVFPLASDIARDVSNRYYDILSSLTLRGLESVWKIVSEAIVLEDIVRNHVEDRQGRIEKRYHQRKRGKQAKPVGENIHNISLEELREQHAEDVNAGNKAQQRLQLRNLRSFAIRQIEDIRDEWRKKEEWLEYTGKDVEYASYDASRAEIRSQLNKKEDFFTIDTQLAPEAREAIRKARFADKPLSSADLSRLLCSDDTVDFTLTQAPADQAEDEDNDLSDKDDLEMPSSPPCLLDRESSLPTIPSTPRPV
ncbi:hypothetical protein F53441_8331 [Fusarium austroafricanum]|uniref:Uncharacterized protein n=1 Tax=Fusarium austroafricanum TaxID=2364996 RepID=A0A8H4NUJ8_9HYPO|nr:hypothetical protein F53441_8331 [Fusarium austroafricanum]